MIVSTIDTWNRQRDAKRILKEHPGLTEIGQESIEIRDQSGVVLATGYERIVYGDHGPYIEFSSEQINWPAFPNTKRKSLMAWYDEAYTKSGVLLYIQKRTVSGLPNPPRGKYSVNNNRSEGYADYKIGYMYIDPDKIRSVQVNE